MSVEVLAIDRGTERERERERERIGSINLDKTEPSLRDESSQPPCAPRSRAWTIVGSDRLLMLPRKPIPWFPIFANKPF